MEVAVTDSEKDPEIFTSRHNGYVTKDNGSVNAGWQTGLELKVIVAVVLGGTRVDGGRGSIVGSILGVFAVTVLEIGLIGIHRSDWILILLGPLLVLGVWLNTHIDSALRAVRST